MIVLSAKNINTNVCEFRADMANDLQYLPTTTDYGTGNLGTVSPCSSGSVCIVTGTGDVYYLNGDKNEWEIYGSESGSGDSGNEPPGGWIKDGKAHYWVNIVAENTTIPVAAAIDEQVESETTIDWGDGSSDTIVLNTSGTDITHTYTNTGTYVITLTAPDDRTAYINRFGGRLGNAGTYQDRVAYQLGSLTFAEHPAISSIPDYNFARNARLTSIALLKGVTSIGNYAFYYCGALTSIVIPKGITSIGNYAFYGCTSLPLITIPESVTSIGEWAFYGCTSLKAIAIPKGVASISNRTFYYCTSLTSITIPEGVISIGDYAFNSCYSLTSVTLPESVTSIGGNAFWYCSALTSMTILAKTPPDLSSFGIPISIKTIYVPAESVNVYKVVANWSTFASKIQAIPA